jgi:hypothetical protein
MIGRSHIIAALAGMVAVSTSHAAWAQQTTSNSGWTFTVAPYLWLPTVNTTLDYNLPGQLDGKAPTDLSSGPGDYIPKLHFATAFGAEAHYDRFSIVTDFMYMSLGSSSSHIKQIDFFGLPSQPIARELELGTSTNLKSTLWTLAGGYTVLQGDWGNFDAIAGFRYLGVNSSTDFNLGLTLTGPRGASQAFGGIGNLSGSEGIWNGIGGVRGRIRLGDMGLFIPYYFDIGAGGSQLTWQVAGGLGYQAGRAGVSLTYRYLSFEQGRGSLVHHLSLGGPMVAVNFNF